MSRKGGYKVIDLGNVTINSNGVTIEGLYERFEGNHGKAVLISGLKADDTEYGDVFVEVTLDDSTYKFTAYNTSFEITSPGKIKKSSEAV